VKIVDKVGVFDTFGVTTFEGGNFGGLKVASQLKKKNRDESKSDETISRAHVEGPLKLPNILDATQKKRGKGIDRCEKGTERKK